MTNIHYLKGWFCLFLSYSNDRILIFLIYEQGMILLPWKSPFPNSMTI